MPTPKEVAEFMKQQLDIDSILYQSTVVYEIAEKFGDSFTYINNNGNMAISKEVLKEFQEITDDEVVWERGSRCWRKREDYDTPGKRQAD